MPGSAYTIRVGHKHGQYMWCDQRVLASPWCEYNWVIMFKLSTVVIFFAQMRRQLPKEKYPFE